jgi:hypothetical protein
MSTNVPNQEDQEIDLSKKLKESFSQEISKQIYKGIGLL